MRDESSFVLVNFAHSVLFYLEHPFAIDNICFFWWSRYDIPGVGISEAFEFSIYHLFPSWPIGLSMCFNNGPWFKCLAIAGCGMHCISNVFGIQVPRRSADLCHSLTTCLTFTTSLNRLHSSRQNRSIRASISRIKTFPKCAHVQRLCALTGRVLRSLYFAPILFAIPGDRTPNLTTITATTNHYTPYPMQRHWSGLSHSLTAVHLMFTSCQTLHHAYRTALHLGASCISSSLYDPYPPHARLMYASLIPHDSHSSYRV